MQMSAVDTGPDITQTCKGIPGPNPNLYFISLVLSSPSSSIRPTGNRTLLNLHMHTGTIPKVCHPTSNPECSSTFKATFPTPLSELLWKSNSLVRGAMQKCFHDSSHSILIYFLKNYLSID